MHVGCSHTNAFQHCHFYASALCEVNVCVCVSVCVCMCVCMCVCVYAHMDTCVNVNESVHVFLHVYICLLNRQPSNSFSLNVVYAIRKVPSHSIINYMMRSSIRLPLKCVAFLQTESNMGFPLQKQIIGFGLTETSDC